MKALRQFLKHRVAQLPLVRRQFHLLRRLVKAHHGGYFKWANVPGIRREPSSGKKSVLVATSVGAHLPSANLESLLGVALSLRNADVKVLLCDKVLPACMDCDQRWFPTEGYQRKLVEEGPGFCSSCFKPAHSMFRDAGLEVLRYSQFLTPQDKVRADEIANSVPVEKIRSYEWEGLQVGEHAFAGAARFFARGDLAGEPVGEPVLRRYLAASLLTVWMARNLFNQIKFESAVFNHGIYVPQGLIGEVARKAGVRVINWNPAYRKGCFVFSHGDTYHHTMMTEPVETWDRLNLSDKKKKELTNYLESRWKGSKDWISFQHANQLENEKIAGELKLDLSKPIIGLLTNVVWDAQLHYPKNAFDSMLDWIEETVRLFKERPDLQLLIRVHPAEVLGAIPSRQTVPEELKRRFGQVPSNVFLVNAEDPINTYAAMQLCDSVIIYGTKTGVELTSMGIPTIVAGEAWVRNKGFTIDIAGKADYKKIIDSLPLKKRMPMDQIERARNYAFHFYFRRMIPLRMVQQQVGWPPFQLKIDDLKEIAPGADRGLDLVCEGILNGKEFVYPAESL